VTAGLAIGGAVLLGGQEDHLTLAKQDALDSIIALTDARAVSYHANADESWYLADPARATQYQDDFLTNAQQFVDVGSASFFGYDTALTADVDAYQSDYTDVPFGGDLGAEFRNITFPGERAAATRALLAYQVYERDDERLRVMAVSNLDQAIAFDVGTSPGQLGWAFSNLTTALGDVIAINETAFTAAVHDGDNIDNGWDAVIPAVAATAIAGLTVAGAWRRVAEYR